MMSGDRYNTVAQNVITQFLAPSDRYFSQAINFGDETMSRTGVLAWHKAFKEGNQWRGDSH